MRAAQPFFVLADCDPLQAGYQAVVDICDEARSEIASVKRHPDFYDPERARTSAQARDSGADDKHISTQVNMPPPQCFKRRSRNPFAG